MTQPALTAEFLTVPDAAALPDIALSDWHACLQPLLAALNWQGTPRQLQETLLSHHIHDAQSFRAALAHLGYASLMRQLPLQAIAANALPVIVLQPDGTPQLLTDTVDIKNPARIAAVLFFEPVAPPIAADSDNSLWRSLARFHPILNQVFLISLLVGVLSLAPTFFNMAVYDHIIASGSLGSLAMLFVGVVLALLAEVGLRHLRSQSLSYFGARIDHFVSCTVFERLLFLAPVYTERSSLSGHLARLRDFESVREFFTGPLASLFFEMPLVAIYLAAMAMFSGWLAAVPLTLLSCYWILILAMNGKIKTHARAAANASSRRHEFLLEAMTKLHDIRLGGLEQIWQQRFGVLSRRAAMTSFDAALSAQTLETASYVLMTLGGVATLGFGVVCVINKTITVGALVASMIIIWRILAPLQMACASMTRVQQLAASTAQVQRLLAVAPEHTPYVPPPARALPQGRIMFHRVILRYAPDAEPALLGVSFEARAGQVVAIKGNNGSGKSSILKLVLGLYLPQAGSVRLDGIDLRQLDPIALRQAISYVPQHADLFPGTIRDNLLFAHPAAREEDFRRALILACALDEINALPHGLDTRVVGEEADTISFLLRQRINLARGYLRPARIMLFDEASHSLGRENDLAFAQVIEGLRGNATVLLATHREDHMRLADILLVMDKGELTHAGPPDQVLAALKGRRS